MPVQEQYDERIFGDAQEWIKNNKEYREEFPTLGGKSRQQKKTEMLQKKDKADFPKFDIKPSTGTQKPVKFSDFQKNIMIKENQRSK